MHIDYAWHVIIYAKKKFHTQQLGNIYTHPNWNSGYAPDYSVDIRSA